jgi:hypothetical protein
VIANNVVSTDVPVIAVPYSGSEEGVQDVPLATHFCTLQAEHVSDATLKKGKETASSTTFYESHAGGCTIRNRNMSKENPQLARL